MSEQAFLQFYESSLQTRDLQEKLKVITSPREIIRLGRDYGYHFALEDIAKASYAIASSQEAEESNCTGLSKTAESRLDKYPSVFYHYEFKFSELQGFDEITHEFEKLKIKPSTVKLDLYEKSFREEDFNSTNLSPDTSEFKQHYNEINSPNLSSDTSDLEYAQRQFHLINLDLHVDHPLYEEYFLAKLRILTLLENYFETEIRFSGSLWYPPNAYRLWHTNEAQPGWRMYLIDFDHFPFQENEKSFFRYMNPNTKELVTLYEKPKIIRFFRVKDRPESLFWHCIVNATTANRWSFGFIVPDHWMDKLRI